METPLMKMNPELIFLLDGQNYFHLSIFPIFCPISEIAQSKTSILILVSFVRCLGFMVHNINAGVLWASGLCLCVVCQLRFLYRHGISLLYQDVEWNFISPPLNSIKLFLLKQFSVFSLVFPLSFHLVPDWNFSWLIFIESQNKHGGFKIDFHSTEFSVF